ncbi:probable transcription factor At4g00390 [Eucalyptus grandis]|uniref:probable transcription factor At4g00390 n=1 Tax=Eucalyptus grandis TaxID=71139 RepID=UPI00052727B9|nr:probable transcription factor At4g00390 [Eucalyptus grandis]
MASSGEYGSASGSGSDSDSNSDLEVATRRPSSAAKAGTGTVRPVAVPGSSQPSSSKRARKGGDAGHGAGPSMVMDIAERLINRSESEVRDKMRELKRKFEKATRTGRIGKTPHDRKIFELSRVLWGSGGSGVPTSPKKKGRHAAAPLKLPEEESSEERDLAGVSSLLELNGVGLDEDILRVGMRMVDRSRVEEIKERLRELRMAEVQMAGERAILLNDLAKLLMDGYRTARK